MIKNLKIAPIVKQGNERITKKISSPKNLRNVFNKRTIIIVDTVNMAFVTNKFFYD